MFTFAKFISSSLAFLTVGSTGAIVAPVALDSSIYRPTKKLKSRLVLQPFTSSEQELKDRLDELKSKFTLALKVTEAAKNLKHKKMKDKFEEIKQKEESLKDKYEELTKKIEKLSKLLKQQSTESMKKLYMQSAISLLEAYEGYFQKLTEHFESQKKTILEIVCTIDKTQASSQDPKNPQETQSNQPCATEEWLKQLKENPRAETASAPPRRSFSI
ncbi:hypothetical protein MHLP_03285 [Candidatus Mycoplasma haematolamae str. Purdue]|uniref:Uncharacterized protein n=1 Tax=Mycoplasma haematolamae (strain Purdue) TaxID=1212765 RepID=I7C6S6_MYCHA|nr:hypothetical protein [Candidatus Mycoplasma haematolamae]AFO52237.1 hypothetical protein MHLP_03285 [Candidatus Mycoplasma haematolamae str. Purdue]